MSYYIETSWQWHLYCQLWTWITSFHKVSSHDGPLEVQFLDIPKGSNPWTNLWPLPWMQANFEISACKRWICGFPWKRNATTAGDVYDCFVFFFHFSCTFCDNQSSYSCFYHEIWNFYICSYIYATCMHVLCMYATVCLYATCTVQCVAPPAAICNALLYACRGPVVPRTGASLYATSQCGRGCGCVVYVCVCMCSCVHVCRYVGM